VLIQTFRPGALPILMAREGRLEDFYAAELDERRQLGFPPFSRLIRLLVRGRNRQKVTEACAALARAAAEKMGAGADGMSPSGEIMGPAEAPLARISGNYRRHLIIRALKFPEAHARVSAALEEFKAPTGVFVEVDVDPQALL